VNLTELQHALRQLRLGGIATVLETRLHQAQAEAMAPIDLISLGDLPNVHAFGRQQNQFRPEHHFLRRPACAILICYEQLLTWPMLRSAVEKPTLLIAISNEAWTASTIVPRVQHMCIRAWARLFGLAVISAI
jgi:apolipoprotein N-acyltransferase